MLRASLLSSKRRGGDDGDDEEEKEMAATTERDLPSKGVFKIYFEKALKGTAFSKVASSKRPPPSAISRPFEVGSRGVCLLLLLPFFSTEEEEEGKKKRVIPHGPFIGRRGEIRQ